MSDISDGLTSVTIKSNGEPHTFVLLLRKKATLEYRNRRFEKGAVFLVEWNNNSKVIRPSCVYSKYIPSHHNYILTSGN